MFNTPGQYSVMGTNPSGNCSRSMSDTVIVIMSPTPVTDFTANLPCFGDTTFFSISGNYINKISQWLWDFGDGTYASFNTPNEPSHVYPSHGTYQVTLSVIDTNGCSYSITHPVEVRPGPNAFFSYLTPNCEGGKTWFTDLSTIAPGVGQGFVNRWIWDFGDGSPADTIYFPSAANTEHNYSGPGTYSVSLSIETNFGCRDIFTTLVIVSRPPDASFEYWNSCQDELAIFNDASNTNGGGAVTSWSWDFGDPASGSLNTSTLEDPTHLYTTAGLYDVTLIVQNFNGCSDTILRQVNVKGAPLADFNSTTGCLGTPTLFWADSTLINLNATATYHWDFGDGSTSNTRNTQYTYIAAGTYTVILTITDTAGCEGSRSHTLIVTPPPTALFSSATDNCQGQTISFNNQSTTESGYLTSWSWNFGDGSPVQTILFPTIPDVSHIYAVTGTFNVTLTVTNSEDCTHSYSRLVNVFGSPSADFMSSGHCKDSPVHFTDLTTTSGSQSLTSWQWNFGDPGSGVFNTSSDQNPIHSYAATGNYTVTLITLTLNGCSDTISYPVTIKPLPVTDFSFQSACQDNPAQFSPSGMAIPTIASWYWSFGDGGSSTLQSPSHVYTFAGTYTVTLTVTDTAGCENQRSHPIIIVPLPLVNFDFSSPACDDQQIQFTDLTTSAAGYVTRWFWDFGDGTTQVINFPATASVSHTYAQSGTFNVTLTVKSSDSCSNLQTKTLTILPKPTALFSHGAACQGAAVSFTDLSLSNTTSGISNWQWDFGDPGSGSSNQSSQQNPIHNFNTAGTYTVRLIAIISGGCSDTVTSTVNVTPPPLVDFSSLAGCSGDTTQFTSSTTVNVNATQSWYWQFGDGLSSTLVDPIHIYAQSGTFNVMLTITDTAGCINTKTNSVVVTPGPLSNFSFNTPACSGTEITFTDLGNGNGGIIGNWYWQFGDDTDTTFTTYHPTVTHTYSQPGTFLVSLTLGTQQGCSHTRVIPVTISASPLTAFNYQNTCQGQATQFTDQTSLNGGPTLVSHSWNFGDPPSGKQQLKYPNQPGT
ncbi:MAG: PKD domain-containing protein [Bacteroidales bacterium]|nr:PKD domain-containing protein [Bacteroidales bacterium]